MTEQTPPRIEFPCDYPVKIIGTASDDFQEVMESVVEVHAPGFRRELTTVRYSGAGRYVALTVTIRATGTDQLRALFEDLKRTGRVSMVL